jgi:hypothetical protein
MLAIMLPFSPVSSRKSTSFAQALLSWLSVGHFSHQCRAFFFAFQGISSFVSLSCNAFSLLALLSWHLLNGHQALQCLLQCEVEASRYASSLELVLPLASSHFWSHYQGRWPMNRYHVTLFQKNYCRHLFCVIHRVATTREIVWSPSNNESR